MNPIKPEEISEQLSKLVNKRVEETLRERFQEEEDFKPKYESLVDELRRKRQDCRELIEDATKHKNMHRSVYFDGQLDLLNDIITWNGLENE